MVGHYRLRILTASLASVAGLAIAACGSEYEKSPVAASGFPGVSHAQKSNARADVQQLLTQVRQVTAKYHNIDAAVADGYVDDGYGCIDATFFGLDASVGAMGFHMAKWSLHDDPAEDPLQPEYLVYEPAGSANGKPKLVALEYEVFRPDWWAAGNTTPPSLFGHEFESFDFDGFQVFGLHVWLWRDNPSGMFTDWNPKVSCR